MPTAQQASGRQGDPGPLKLGRPAAVSWSAISPHGKQARSIVRLASTELKPSGSGPAPRSPSRSAAAITRAASSRLVNSDSTHA